MKVDDLLSQLVDMPDEQRDYEIVVMDRDTMTYVSIDPDDVRFEHDVRQVVLHEADSE